MGIFERIEDKCKEKNISIRILEQKAEVSNGMIGKWKKLDQKPAYDKVEKIAKTLNVSIDWLITGKEPEDLTREEREIIEHYRNMNETGKRLLKSDAADLEKNYPVGVSASKIG